MRVRDFGEGGVCGDVIDGAVAGIVVELLGDREEKRDNPDS